MLEEGKVLADRYEILAKVGAGGMSDVYKAKDHVLGRFVAMKILKQEFGDDVNFVTKFRTEAQSAAGLEHPNIVNIYDVGSEDGFHYIVMEYVEGITLKTYIEKKGRLSYKEAISIAIQVGRGIEAAHNKNIVHRDIKPQNIMISTEGKVKVTDFGIARAATNNTINSDVMGSVHYSSPEQARNGFVDGKSDIYSLGIVMYEMVTGRVPFDGDTTVAIAIQHLQEEMESPRSYVPDLPVSLEKIILKCTQKSADRRYPAIDALMNDLKRSLATPDEDFVSMPTVPVQDKTRVISPEEVTQIKEGTEGIHVSPQELKAQQEQNNGDDEDDDEGGGFLNPKMEKAMTIMGIIAAVIILLIIIYLAGSMLGAFSFGPLKNKNKDKDVPEITTSDYERSDTDTEDDTDTASDGEEVEMIKILGMTLEEAREELEKRGLKIYKLGSEESDEYEEGQIISQSVEAGSPVEKGTIIEVTVCSGPSQFAVPKVTGETAEDAKRMLEAAELKVSTKSDFSDTVPEGRVISQSPQAGTMASRGDSVTITVSQGIQQVQVPDLRNRTQEEAAELLSNSRLQQGKVTKANDDTVPEGSIISQSPQPGSSAGVGTRVDYVISLGKKEVLYELRALSIPVPSNSEYVITADIELLDANGESVQRWNNVSISSFPYTISAKDITTSSGTLSIDWILEDGDIDNQTEKVEFSEQ